MMLEEEREGLPRRHCPNCRAEVRTQDAFCASCGKPLGPEGSDQAVHNTAPEESDVDGPKPDGDALDKPISSADDRSERTDSGGRRSWGDALRGRARWFGELPAVSKVVVAGLVIVFALPLLVLALSLLALLSPLTMVFAAVLFGVGLIGLIVRLGQRKSAKGWGIVTVGSVALVAVSGYFSIVVYSSLFDSSAGSTGSGSSKNATKQTAANYDVVVPPRGFSGRNSSAATMIVKTEASKDEGELEAVCRAVSKELSERYPQYEAVTIKINDSRIQNHGEAYVGTAAYFRNEYAERDYIKLHGSNYNVSC